MKHTLSKEYKKFHIIAFVLAAAHLVFGATKLIGQPDLMKEFTELWGFPLWMMYFIGGAQVAGAIGLTIFRLRVPAALAMALIMLGGIVTVVNAGQVANIFICSLVMLLCLAVFGTTIQEQAKVYLQLKNKI